jgi:hypothetical protein
MPDGLHSASAGDGETGRRKTRRRKAGETKDAETEGRLALRRSPGRATASRPSAVKAPPGMAGVLLEQLRTRYARQACHQAPCGTRVEQD